jgi:hypothetical protein
MEAESNCKGCLRSVKVASEDIQNMIDKIINSKDFNLVLEEEYNKRLQHCKSCKYLMLDTTCSQCGCIVQVRALLREQDCPHPKEALW